MYEKKNASPRGHNSIQEEELQFSHMSNSRQTESAPASRTLSPEEKARRAAARKRAARKREQQKQRRVLLLALFFLLVALTVLIWAIFLLMKKCNGTESLPSQNTPVSSNAPVTSGELAADTLIPKNVTVNGVKIGGKTVTEARTLLESAFESTLNSIAINLKNDSIDRTLTRSDINASYDVETALSQAAAAEAGSSLTAPLSYEESALTAVLYALNEQVPNHAVNATLTFEYESYSIDGEAYRKPHFVYNEGQNGMQLDYEGILAQVETALSQGEYTASITPNVTVSEPAVTVESLKAATMAISSYTTTYRFKGTTSMSEDEIANCMARDDNITKGVSIMSVITLEPGESFSFNKTTGDRSEKNGWAYANAVYNSGYRKETGGGICQVSTTMFNALIRAGIDITYHKEHSIPSDYVPLGFDATVNYGSTDFKFKNNRDTTLYLFLYITQNKDSSRKKDIHVEVYGVNETGITYKTRSTTDATDPAVDPIIKYDKTQYTDYSEVTRAAHDGYTITIYVDKYVNGVFDSTIYTYTAVYEKIEQITVVGTMEIATPTPKVTNTPDPTLRPPDDDLP